MAIGHTAGTDYHPHRAKTVARIWLRGSRRIIERIQAAVALWRRRALERRMLACMTEREIKDIGVTRVDVWRETRKPWWQP